MSQPTQRCALEAKVEKDSRIRELEARVAELEGALTRAGAALPAAEPLAACSPARANRGGRKAKDEGVPTADLSPAGLKRRKRQKQQQARRERKSGGAVGDADIVEADAAVAGAAVAGVAGAEVGTVEAAARCAACG